jgi:resuscitation-promoting factor RpfA
VLCPRCRRENREQSEFCAACGAPLLLRDDPAPSPLEVTVPLDRRGPSRTPLPPLPRGAHAEPSPRAPDANERSYWDLGRAVAAPEPSFDRLRMSGTAAGGAAGPTWDGGPVRSAHTADPGPSFDRLRMSGTTAGGGLGPLPALADDSPFPPSFAPPSGAPGRGTLDLELDLADLDPAPAPEVVLHRAPSWRRALSWAIDLVPFAALTAWVAREATGPNDRAALRSVDGALDLIARDLGVVLPFLGFLGLAGAVYLALAHALMGASIGKWLTGLRVVAPDGRRPTPRRAAARAALTVLSVGLVGLGVLLALFTRSGRALHDFLAGTWVVVRPGRGERALGALETRSARSKPKS